MSKHDTHDTPSEVIVVGQAPDVIVIGQALDLATVHRRLAEAQRVLEEKAEKSSFPVAGTASYETIRAVRDLTRIVGAIAAAVPGLTVVVPAEGAW